MQPVLPPRELSHTASEPGVNSLKVATSVVAVPSVDPVITEHPLFYPSRKPWVPPLPTPVAPVHIVASPPPRPRRAPPSNYILVGTLLSGDTHSALLRQANGNKTTAVREGQVLDGWTLREIREGHVLFEADGSLFELTFPPLSQAGHIK